MLVSAFLFVAVAGMHPQIVAALPRVPLPRPTATALRAITHGNRVAAGIRTGRVLTLALDVVNSAWKPEGDDDPEVPVLAFAEHGQAPLVPGPMIRVPQGTDVALTLRNLSDSAVTIGGLRPRVGSAVDSIQLPARATKTIRFRLGDHMFKPIAPGDSFVAEFTPPRAGTFPYHSHLNERKQILSGMYGAIIVTDTPRDLAHDHLIVAGGGGPELLPKTESPYALVNGRRAPTLQLTAGETHRLRLVSVHPDWRVSFTLRNDSTTARWRAIAKDGATMPQVQATMRLAHVEMGPGETADFEFTPVKPGRWLMEVSSVEAGWFVPMEITVVAPKPKRRK